MDNANLDHQFGSATYELNSSSVIKFELKSAIGRLFSKKNRVAQSPLLQIGCGPNIFDEFENVDFYTMRFWQAKHIGHDLRYPLPYGNAVFEGAFSEHTLEHLPSRYAIKLLAEVKRVLKPGSVFRISVPDLKQYIDFYNGNSSNPEFKKFSSGCEAIWSLTQNWTHLSCWDSSMLVEKLLEVGFQSAKKTAYLEGSDKRLLRDSKDRQWESVYVEAIV
ncbi:MAG TPA: methyltransferase domain-containing protein [bacterium]|jgi:predicted SAM-dependent methyltransferase|nr:methyltransferase domain-containing protein [bacterium]